jgi:hypothetical protein
MNRYIYFTLPLLSLLCCSHLNSAASAVTPAQEQAAIKQVREQVRKNKEEALRKSIPADWSTLPATSSVLNPSLAALRLNVDVEQANQALQKHAAGKLMGGIPEFYHCMEYYAQIYYMFNSKSRLFPGRLTPQTEAAMKAQMWEFIQRAKLDGISQTDPLQLSNTENHDLRGRSACYLYCAALKDDPEYRDRKCADGHTAGEFYEALNEFYKKNLKARALGGIWFEIGSSQYAKHNWPSMLVLADASPDETVRRYARMLLDLAWVENSELSFGFARLGGTVRGGHPGPYISMFAPLLFGEKVIGCIWAASDYEVPDIAILLHRFGSNEPPCEIINKVPCKDNKWQGSVPLLNYTYKTPLYGLGGLMLNPSDTHAPITQDRRMQWLIFNDPEKSGVGINPNGGKFVNSWVVQHKNVMVVKKYTSAHPNKIAAHILPGPEVEEVDGWVFVKRGDAFAAVRAAFGGCAWDKAISGKGGLVTFNDEWAPIILHAGDVAEFGSYDTFKEKILKAELKVTDDAVIYKGPGQPTITFYHKQLNGEAPTQAATNAGETASVKRVKMPEIDGKPVNLNPALSYQSPFMSSVPGTEKVRTAFGSCVKEYDFGK